MLLYKVLLVWTHLLSFQKLGDQLYILGSGETATQWNKTAQSEED